ncbi:MAG TPA: 50S ribosomal protein L25 [Candidatus Saccharimonadales bacterium]|nr:50S ribosomal protein L25 [Candidatus Saccharimonadales bacterium]
MAEDISLKLDERTVVGKQVRQLRRDGLVPAVIHDHGKPSIHVMGNYIDVYKAYRQAGRHHMINLSVGNKTYSAIIKNVEFEPRKHQISHIVFGSIKADEKVTAEIPVKLTEDIPAEKASLIVIHQLELIEVEALPKDLPNEFIVDATKLAEVGDKLTVADIIVPAGVTIITGPEHAVATVFEPSAVAAANDAVGGDAEPEDAEDVEAEHESGTEDETQAEELRPGGKKEFEDKEQSKNPEKK